MNPSVFDDDTIRSIRVLAAAVERERVPGVVEFRLLADALDRALADRDHDELERAAVAYGALDVEFRRRIAERARALATAVRADPTMVEAPRRPAEQPRAPTGLLAALNYGRPAPASRSVARSRLLAEVGGGDPDDPSPTGAKDGGPPPAWWTPSD